MAGFDRKVFGFWKWKSRFCKRWAPDVACLHNM